MSAAVRELAARPMMVGRPADLARVYANPSQELQRLSGTGEVLRLAHGVYVAVPLGVQPGWKPLLEDGAMAWATALYGDRVPILMGVGAARFHHAIPRAIAVTVIALPVQHRALDLLGGRVWFARRDVDGLAARTERGELGEMLVTTQEQTLLDLVSRPALGGLAGEALEAARVLARGVDRDMVRDLAREQRKLGPVDRFLKEH